jgi:uncharacterized membrane protein
MQSGNEHQEWSSRDNWGDGVFGLYFSKRDPRLWVPKRNPRFGWTVNLGHPRGGLVMFGIILMAGLLPAILVTGAMVAGAG